MAAFNHNSGQYADIDGVKIYFEEIGNKENPVLLMLHGGLGNIENLNSIASYFSEVNLRIRPAIFLLSRNRIINAMPHCIRQVAML